MNGECDRMKQLDNVVIYPSQRKTYSTDLKQLVIGIIGVIMCIGMIVLASSGRTISDRDCTPVLLIMPIAVILILDAIKNMVSTYIDNRGISSR